MHKVLAIVGPTAVGKTALSIEMAKQMGGEIISGDSMQVYRGLDIGTAKVEPAEMRGVPHHLINICDVQERYTAAKFVSDAKNAIGQIENAGKVPIVAGGTGFYLQALEQGLNLGGQTHSQTRAKLMEQAEIDGAKKMHDWLSKVDPRSADIIPANNVRRVVRALEVYLDTGEKFSEQSNLEKTIDFHYVALTAERSLLYQRINHRVDLMIEQGLMKEARWLFEQGGRSLPASQGIGYHELFDFFEGKVSESAAIEQVKQDSRRYAKRQLTWFRNKVTANWYNLIEEKNSISEIISDTEKWLRN